MVAKIITITKRVREAGLRRALRYVANQVLTRDVTIVLRKDLSLQVPCPEVPGIEFRWLERKEIEPYMKEKRAFNADDVTDFFARGARCLGALEGARIAGYMWIHTDFYKLPFFGVTLKMGPGEAFLGPAFVDPEFRRRNIYTALLVRSFEVLKEEGYRVAVGNVSPDNVSSVKGVKKAGFAPTRRITAVRVFRRFLVYRSEQPCDEFK